MLAAALILFAVASLACGLAQWPLMLIVARIVQGSAGALVTAAIAALIYGLSNGQQHGFGTPRR